MKVTLKKNHIIIAVLLTILPHVAAPKKSGQIVNAQPIENEQQVIDLIHDLDAGSIIQRNGAEAQLTKMGPPVLKFLDRPRSAEAAFRSARIRKSIERQVLSQAISPTRINLVGEFSLPSLVEQIEEQSGNQLDISVSSAQPIEINLNDQTFWSAIESICSQQQLSLDHDRSTARKLVLRPRDDFEEPPDMLAHHSQGPFRLECTSLASPSHRRSARAKFRLFWEPRINPLTVRIPLSTFSIEDEAGGQWATFNSAATLNLHPGKDQGYVEFETPMRRLTSESSAKFIRCQLQIIVVGQAITLLFDDVISESKRPNRSTRSFGDLTVRFGQIQLNRRSLSLELISTYNPRSMASEIESHFRWSQFHQADLIDSMSGNRLKYSESRQIRQDPFEYSIEFGFNLSNEGSNKYGLDYKLPSGLQSADATFEIKLN